MNERNNILHANRFISCSVWRLANFLADTSCPFEEMGWQCCPDHECRKKLPDVDKDKKTTCWRMWANVRKDGVLTEPEAIATAHNFLYNPAHPANKFMTKEEMLQVRTGKPPSIRDCGCGKKS